MAKFSQNFKVIDFHINLQGYLTFPFAFMSNVSVQKYLQNGYIGGLLCSRTIQIWDQTSYNLKTEAWRDLGKVTQLTSSRASFYVFENDHT